MSRVSLICVCLLLHVVTVFCQFGFFPQREERRQPFGFAQNFFPNPKRLTETLSGILHFQPGNQDRNQQYINPGISNNRPNYDQYRPNRPNQFQNPNNVRFPNNADIPYDNVNYERPREDPGLNNNPEYNNVNPGNNFNGGFVPSNGDNGGLVSGTINGPVFGNNENGGLISGTINNPPFANDNGGESDNANGGLISGTYDERPVFATKDNGNDGQTEPPSPIMVVEEAENLPVFGDRNAENDEVTPSNLPELTPVPTSEGKNNMVFDNGPIFQETCQTVDGNIGTCVSIKGCQPYIKLVQESRTNPEAVRVLRSALCGFEGNNPKVCCPPAVIPDVPPPSPAPPAPTAPPASPKTAIGDFVTTFPEPPICGVSNASFSRVVGGIKAKLGDFPWMALLGYKSKRDGSTRWLCGGSLVTSRHVMTAAHCIHNHETDLYVVRLGELDLAREDEGATPVDIIIKSKLKHENYDPKGFTNDIGILFLERDVQFTDLIRPICMPKDAELRARSFENYNPIIAGWGDTEFRGPSASHLQVLQLPVVSNDQCAQVYSAYKAQVIDKRVLCAGYKSGGKDACQGDSGGPLMQPIWNSETFTTFFYQIGVVSFGKQCALAGFPGVYTRVTEFIPWIQKHMLGSA